MKVTAEERDVSVNWLITKLLTDAIDMLIPVDQIILTRRDQIRRPWTPERAQ